MSDPGASDGVLADRGAQAERTLLAWSRTCIALAGTGALLVRFSAGAAPFAVVLGLSLGAAATLTYVGARRRYEAVRRGDSPGSGLLRWLVAVSLTVATCCAVSSLLSAPTGW